MTLLIAIVDYRLFLYAGRPKLLGFLTHTLSSLSFDVSSVVRTVSIIPPGGF